MASRFATPFSGSLRKYADLSRENAQAEGYWAYRQRSSISGQPEPVYLDTAQAVKEFNAAEGLTAPGEIPRNSTISADGKTIQSNGMPGQWNGGCGFPPIPARLQEMIDCPAEKCSTENHNFVPCMPMDYGITSEVVAAPQDMGV